jgi:hypothetical protein
MQNSSAFQFLALDTIHESAANPRRTFEDSKLHELAESIRQHGLIQPITVRPNSEGFEIVAGARRFSAAQLAELFAIPARIVELSAIDGLQDDKLTGFALRLALTGHIDIAREGEFDFLAEAEAVFAPLQPKKAASKKLKAKTPTPIKAASTPEPKKTSAKKKTAA